MSVDAHPDDEELSVLSEWLISRGQNGKPPLPDTVTHVMRCQQCGLLVLEVLAGMLETLHNRHKDN